MSIRWGKLNDLRGRGGGWFAFPKGRMSDKPVGMVRLAHPNNVNAPQLPLFYDSNTASWVVDNYTVWRRDDWWGKFGHQLQTDGRKWEHFGTLIPLYDDDDPNKVK